MKADGVIRKDIAAGGSAPAGWRMAWYEPKRRVGVYAPMPLHWIMRMAREIAHRLRTALAAPPIERSEFFEMQRKHQERQRLAEEYSRGYLRGWKECFDTCLDVVEDEFGRASELWIAGELMRECSTDQQN